MQMQDYLPLFQELSLQYYQFTLENPVYAACLALVVWLLTSIFYSLRIGFLNRRNNITLKASIDAQNAVTAAQQEIQQLQTEITTVKEQLEQETQRTSAAQERIAGLAGQLSESIVALASQPDLGQQGLSVSPGLEAEHLWQRYSAAVKQMGETLIDVRRANHDLQQTCDAEKARLTEKEGQLQATQTRLDSQRQQLAKLEQTVEEQKNQLAQQQESIERQLADMEVKHQADLARLAVAGQKVQEAASAKPQDLLQEKPKIAEVPAVRPEPIKPVETRVEPEVAAVVAKEPVAVRVEPKPAVVPSVPASTIARAEEAQQKTVKAPVGPAGGVGGKFKAWFAGAKQQMEKLDDMFGLNSPMLPPEEPREFVQAQSIPQETPAVAEAQVSVPEAQAVEPRSESKAKESSSGLSGKFKNLFGSTKLEAAEPAVEQPAEPVVAESRPVETSQADTGKAEGKFRNLFGKFKKGA